MDFPEDQLKAPSADVEHIFSEFGDAHLVLMLGMNGEWEILEGVSLAWDVWQLKKHIATAHPIEQRWSANLIKLSTSNADLDENDHWVVDEHGDQTFYTRSLQEYGLKSGDEVQVVFTQHTDPIDILAKIEAADYFDVDEVLVTAPEDVRRNRAVVMAAVTKRGEALIRASDHLKSDRTVVMAALEESGYVLRVLPDKLTSNREIVLAAVSKDGMALLFAAEKLRSDRSVLMAALEQNPMALQYASEELLSDHAVVLAAVEKCGSVLQFAPDELRSDRTIVIAAVKQNRDALRYALNNQHNNLCRDPELRKIVGKKAAERMEVLHDT